MLSEEERARILQTVVVSAPQDGGRVVAQSLTSASLLFGEPVSHVTHLLASVFTCGLWLPVWVYHLIAGGEETRTVTVDPYGRVVWR